MDWRKHRNSERSERTSEKWRNNGKTIHLLICVYSAIVSPFLPSISAQYIVVLTFCVLCPVKEATDVSICHSGSWKRCQFIYYLWSSRKKKIRSTIKKTNTRRQTSSCDDSEESTWEWFAKQQHRLRHTEKPTSAHRGNQTATRAFESLPIVIEK